MRGVAWRYYEIIQRTYLLTITSRRESRSEEELYGLEVLKDPLDGAIRVELSGSARLTYGCLNRFRVDDAELRNGKGFGGLVGVKVAEHQGPWTADVMQMVDDFLKQIRSEILEAIPNQHSVEAAGGIVEAEAAEGLDAMGFRTDFERNHRCRCRRL